MAKISLSGVSSGADASAGESLFKPSPQQQAIFDHVEKLGSPNLIVEARAGTGKTTTLVEMCRRLRGTAVFTAFNKGIATEIQQKLAAAGVDSKRVRGSTFHSVGFQAWVRHAPQSGRNVRAEKLSILMDKISTPRTYQPFCKALVSLAKQSCIGIFAPLDDDSEWLAIVEHHDLLDLMPEADDEIDSEEFLATGLAWSLKLLKQSIAEAQTLIDFDDMIYMPLYENLKLWQYDNVLVDEAQDTNRARRELSKRLLRPGGRLVAVGDRHQAIYGFTGASHDALDLIEHDFDAAIRPLTVTYRCASSIVRLAQTWVPDIEARPDAPAGLVRMMAYEDFLKTVPEPTDAILCRNTKPLVSLAFQYLRKHIGCHIEGREIGGALITLIKKWKGAQNIGELAMRLEEHRAREAERLLAQHKEAQLASLEDKIDTILVLADTFADNDYVDRLIDLINTLFKDGEGLAKQTITLSTVHKAKGREWDRVFILGRNAYMPSRYARQEWQLEQERNLMYVAVTRARTELIDVIMEDKKPRRRTA